MDENKALEAKKSWMDINWPGFFAGLVLGAGLFYITIRIISALMFSRTAA
ncbi:MAG: hypothetical protein PHH31_06850 [Acidaminococcaceae bacterium]|nr:hypothetical protein [Acidaminococcaceae bacterium]MDD4721772.1 hypothetical protein [Acidaminococcaceae bacterium]